MTFDLETLVRIIAPGMGNLPNNLGVSRTFRLDLSTNTSQTHHVTLRLRPLTLEVIALVGDTGLCTKFKVVGLPVRKILRIYCVSINRSGDLDL